MQKLGKETIGQKRTNKESEVFMIVRGNAMWASVFDKNTLSDKYQIDICNLDNKTVKELEKAGLKVKSGDGDKADKGKGGHTVSNSPLPKLSKVTTGYIKGCAQIQIHAVIITANV